MKIKNKLMVAAVVGMFSAVSVEAQNASGTTAPPSNANVITVPPGRTTVEIAPGSTVVESPASSTVIQSQDNTATVMAEPAGASYDNDSPGWNMRERFNYNQDADDRLYPDSEITFDLFGLFADDKGKFKDTFNTSMRDGQWGAGLGVNYFITRNVGIGADAFGIDNGDDLVDAVSASLILRVPIDVAHLAPYVFGGGGRQLEGSDTWTLHGGVGLELRMNRHTGIFLDGRYVWPDDNDRSDYALLRAGVRFAF